MSPNMNRRKFMEVSAATGIGMAIAGNSFARPAVPPKKTVKVGVVGTGNRGKSLMGNLLHVEGVEIPAICDINQEHLKQAEELLTSAGRAKPELYIKDEHTYKKMFERDDLDAVIIATYWEWHTPMAVDAIKAGKYAGVEVPAAYTLDECWDLVNTYEETKVPCMMMENWSFRRDNLAVLKMIREGMFGDIVHCHCAHSHDCIDHWFFDPDTGTISVDDMGIETMLREEMRNAYALVPQDPVIFATTAIENIRFGRPGATDAEVVEALGCDPGVNEFESRLSPFFVLREVFSLGRVLSG